MISFRQVHPIVPACPSLFTKAYPSAETLATSISVSYTHLYLAEFLLQKGYEVHGILRRSSSFNTGRIEHLYFDEWVRDIGFVGCRLAIPLEVWG